jgi:hypothetical protein
MNSPRSKLYPDELGASKVMQQKPQKQCRDSKLGSPVEVKKRAHTDTQINHLTKASQPLDWPPLYADHTFMAESDWILVKRKNRVVRVVIVEHEKSCL